MRSGNLHLLAIASLLFCACSHLLSDGDNSAASAEGAASPEFEKGYTLSKVYCAACHVYPESNLLDRQTWAEQVMPAMGPKMGIFSFEGEEYRIETDPYLPEDYYPENPMISDEEWRQILDYYQEAAPEALGRKEPDVEITEAPLFFNIRMPEFRTEHPPMISAVRMDPGNQLLYVHDAHENKLRIFDLNLDVVHEFTFPSPIAHINFTNDVLEDVRRQFVMTFIGSLDSSDEPSGLVIEGWYDHNTNVDVGQVVQDNVVRPVNTQVADLNRDGWMNYVISEFGHRRGSLFWLDTIVEEEQAARNVLLDAPGCIESHVTDFNGNGWKDVVALCAQAEQRIYLFENMGDGQFERSTLLQFNIAAGSSSFKLHDFNNNGHPDILYTSGDNADYSNIFKPYHGVYIYLNDGFDNFEKAWFYPVNGAFNAQASDFTGNGHPDIAVISYFADYVNRPEESFLFFKNKGDLDFIPYHHPEAAKGRWLAMDVHDWTGNGYDDIVLANMSVGPTDLPATIVEEFRKGPPFLLLINQADQ